MRWWEHLYLGKKAEKSREKVLKAIRQGTHRHDLYVITLPESGNHILDIRPASLLTEEERKDQEFWILGVSIGYTEALEVVRTMIDDMYRQTGSFDWNAYMKEKA